MIGERDKSTEFSGQPGDTPLYWTSEILLMQHAALWGSKCRTLVFIKNKTNHLITHTEVLVYCKLCNCANTQESLQFSPSVPRSPTALGPRSCIPAAWIISSGWESGCHSCPRGLPLVQNPTSYGSDRVTRKDVPRSGNTKGMPHAFPHHPLLHRAQAEDSCTNPWGSHCHPSSETTQSDRITLRGSKRLLGVNLTQCIYMCLCS